MTTETIEDKVYAEAAARFAEAELAALIWAITVINGWNRIAVSTRMEAGSYRPEAAR